MAEADVRIPPHQARIGISGVPQPSLVQVVVAVEDMPLVEARQEELLDTTDQPDARGRARRTRRPPARYRQDSEPEHQDPVPEGNPDSQGDTGSHYIPSEILETLKEIRTPVLRASNQNRFGVMKRYTLYNEAASLTLNSSGSLHHGFDHGNARPKQGCPSFGPFESKSGFLLAEWYWNSTNKSFADFQKLISIFRDPDFCVTDSVKLNWKSAFKSLGANRDDLPEEFSAWLEDDGWNTIPISIDIPFHSQTKDPGTKPYVVGQFRYRSLMSVIKEKLSNQRDAGLFHYYPYEETWKPTASSPVSELYGEVYASHAFREAHRTIQQQPSTKKNGGLERVVVALMIWSDSTQLTSFGGASLWPCYLFFGNESKYRRAQPSERLGHHVAYFIKLPDHLNDHLKDRNGGKLPTDALFAYCAKELFHKQWSILLDSEFSAAVKEGFVFLCPDGKERCFYPRIFTYAADYPEKVLVAGLRNNGGHPCHRCLIGKDAIFKLGSPADTERDEAKRQPAQQKTTILHARAEIEKGYAVNSSTFEESLKAFSLVPIESAFETCLSFDITAALVADVLHEFEIGVWKRLFIHLMRLLHAFSTGEGVTLSAELDARYRAMSAFGRDKIRKFPLNASEMRRKAARDFENLLQCAIPAFESLIPEPHNSVLMTLLYLCAQWHALAKLRLHNDLTLQLLDYTTARLGAQMRLFDKTTCSSTPTKELEKEAEARARRDIKQGRGKGSAARRPIQLGIYTIKFHFLGDYASVIRRFGTTDSYSTQIGELYHRVPKTWYGRTDKKEYEVQLSQIERRQARLSQIRQGMIAGSDSRNGGEGLQSPRPGYTIGINANSPIRLDSFTDSVSDLKRHLLPRILKKMGCAAGMAGQNAWQHVVLHESRLFSHKILRTAYIAYDMRQDEDVVHVDTPQCNVMLLNRSYSNEACNSQSPYLYAKVDGIFHANVSFVGQHQGLGPHSRGWHRLEFVRVRWLRFLKSKNEFGLDMVESASGPDAWAFIDPQDILRGLHLIPRFAQGKQEQEQDTSSTDGGPYREGQWEAYYINKFVDRDMFMRYQHGMSVGHSYMYEPGWPPAHMPSIPADFNWSLDIQNDAHVDEEGDDEVVQSRAEGYEGVGGLEDMDDRELAVYHEMFEDDYRYRR